MKKQAKTSFLSNYIIHLKRIKEWITSGDPVPKTHYKSMAIMTGLLIIGIPSFVFFILTEMNASCCQHITSPSSLAVVSFLTLTPGLYVLWLTICCWRRIDGYKWGMIPFFD